MRRFYMMMFAFVAIYMAASSFVLTFGWIPTDSMENSIKARSLVLVDQVSYGALLPRRFSEVALVKNVFYLLPYSVFELDLRQDWGNYRLPGLRSPCRGDIIVFESPEDTRELLCKRIVALSGDTLSIRRGICYVNGEKQCFPQTILLTHDKDTVFDAHFPSGTSWNKHNYGPLSVPFVEGRPGYFVLGDNRAVSRDSRTWGIVGFDKIKGRIVPLW